MELTSYAGIVVQLETTEAYGGSGDGGSIQPPLGLHLQFHDLASRTYGYASAFAVPLASAVGEETSVYLPLTSFDRGSRMGYQCNGCQMDFSAMNEMDIYVLFQEGPFDVRVKAITAVDTPKTYPSPVISIASKNEIKGLIDSTIDSGGSLYDYGYGELCIAVYRSTLNTLLAAGSAADVDSVVTNVIKGMICQGLQRAETQNDSKTSTAWTLRYTLDGILEELGFSDPDETTGWRPDATMAESLADRCSGVTSGAYISMSSEPTQRPTAALTTIMTKQPTISPTLMPIEPTISPTLMPIVTSVPIMKPTNSPTRMPIETTMPMMKPTISPTLMPIETAMPMMKPTISPTLMPVETTSTVVKPTISPTLTPSAGIKAASLPTDAAYPNAPTPGSESPPTDTTIDDNNTSKMIASSTSSSSSSSSRNAGVVAAVTTTVLLYVMM